MTPSKIVKGLVLTRMAIQYMTESLSQLAKIMFFIWIVLENSDLLIGCHVVRCIRIMSSDVDFRPDWALVNILSLSWAEQGPSVADDTTG